MKQRKQNQKSAKVEDFSVVDLFCGIGGLTNGFVSAGFSDVKGVDLDEDCKYAYEENNGSNFVHADVSSLSTAELLKLFTSKKRKILIGCAPCQPYSIFNRPNKKDTTPEVADPRWGLLYSFSDLIDKIRPEVVSMENVPLLKKFKGGKLLQDFIQKLEDAGYHVSCEVVDAQNYGVPQRRSRLVLLASLHGKIEIPKAIVKKPVTVKEAIGYLPPISAGECHPSDPLHRSRNLNSLSKQRMRATPEGGSWKDWDDDLKLECHKRPGGVKYGSVYGRMSWNDVAPTITTYCVGINNGRFGHPVQDRAISLREAAILQSFPANYTFGDPLEKVSLSDTAKHIGNAVPPLLGLAIAKQIKNHLNIV